jgi:glycosyltransferase involved in cell wall biosynthesis
MDISVVIIAKNEEHCIATPIRDLKPYVSEILVFDDSSTDGTRLKARNAGADKVIPLPFQVKDKGFAEGVNFMFANASGDWILLIDADETIDNPEGLHPLTRYPDVNAWALPRRKWWNFQKKIRTEYESYPDWQVRFVRNIPENRFVGEMHIRFQAPHVRAYRGPHIEHLQDENRNQQKLVQRNELYSKLASIQGVAVHGGHLLESK